MQDSRWKCADPARRTQILDYIRRHEATQSGSLPSTNSLMPNLEDVKKDLLMMVERQMAAKLEILERARSIDQSRSDKTWQHAINKVQNSVEYEEQARRVQYNSLAAASSNFDLRFKALEDDAKKRSATDQSTVQPERDGPPAKRSAP
jgi:hypothetical protein